MLALALSHATGVSEPKIGELLASVGLAVAASTLSDRPIRKQEASHAEARAVYDIQRVPGLPLQEAGSPALGGTDPAGDDDAPVLSLLWRAVCQPPRPPERERLRAAFRHLFGTATGYPAPDARLTTTLAHERELASGARPPRAAVAPQCRRAGRAPRPHARRLFRAAHPRGCQGLRHLPHHTRKRVPGHRPETRRGHLPLSPRPRLWCQSAARLGQPDHLVRPDRRPGRLLNGSWLP